MFHIFQGEDTSTAADDKELTKDALKKKNTTPKLIQPNRRSSRNSNIGMDVSELSNDTTTISKTSSDHVDASSKQIQKSTTIESIQFYSNKSATSVLTETLTLAKINSIETSSKLVERDVDGETSKFMDEASPKPTRKSDLDVTLKPKIMSIGVVSYTTPILKSLDVEGPARCTRQSKSFDVSSKSSSFEVTPKSTRRSLEVSSKLTEIKDTRKAEAKDTVKSSKEFIDVSSTATEIKDTPKSTKKSNEVSPKSTEIKNAPKSLKQFTEVSSKSTEVKDTPKPEIKNTPKADFKDTPKSTRRPIDVPSKATKIKDTRKAVLHVNDTSKSMGSIDVASKSKEIKDTPKSTRRSIDVPSKVTEIKDTTKSTRRSIDVASKAIDIKHNPKAEVKDIKSSRSSIKVDVTTKSNMTIEGESSSKKTKNSIGVAGHLNPTQNAAEVSSKSNNVDTTSKLKTSIDVPKKPTRKSDDKVTQKSIDEGVPQKPMTKSKDNEVTTEFIEVFISQTPSKEHENVETALTTRKLKEINIFLPSSSRKTKNIKLQPKPTKKSKDDAAKLANVETTPKSIRISTDVSTNAIQSGDSNKTKREPSNAEMSSNITRDRVPKETKEVFTPTPTKETKHVIIPSKSIEKSGASSSTSKRKSIDVAKGETTLIEKDIYPKSRRKSNILSNVTSKSPQKTVCVEIDIPAQCEKTATTDNDTASGSKSNSQGISADASLSSISGNDITHPSSNQNSFTTSEDSSKSQEIFVVSIKKEILPKCGVCNQEVEDSQWLEHIAKEHDYLAWREDETPLVR